MKDNPDESGPWSSIGGEETLERRMLGLTRHSRITANVLGNMAQARLSGITELLERVKEVDFNGDSVGYLGLLMVGSLESEAGTARADHTGQDDGLAGLASMAIIITDIQGANAQDRPMIVAEAQERLDNLSLNDYDRAVLQSMISGPGL